MLTLWGRCRPVGPEGRGGELRGRGYEAQTKIWGFGVPSFSQEGRFIPPGLVRPALKDLPSQNWRD